MNLGNFKDRVAKAKEAPPSREYKRFQVLVAEMIKEYGIKPPGTFRIWRLAKINPGYIETTWKALNDSVEPQKRKDSGGLLISKLFKNV